MDGWMDGFIDIYMDVYNLSIEQKVLYSERKVLQIIKKFFTARK